MRPQPAWGAQMIAPYVDEEIAWAVQNHQALRYFADESVGYKYPESYVRFFGEGYVPPDYIREAAEGARRHRWYRGHHWTVLPRTQGGTRLRRVERRSHVAYRDMAEQRSLKCTTALRDARGLNISI